MNNFTPIFYILSLYFFSSFSLQAQQVPDRAMPQNGDVVFSVLGDTSGISEGPAGQNLNWDFSNLRPMDGMLATKTVFVDPSATLASDSFPQATLAAVVSTLAGDVYSYYTQQAKRLDYIGSESFGSISRMNIDPQLVVQTGQSIGQDIFDVFGGASIQAASSIFFSGNQQFTVDAAGSLQLPSGNYSNAVRLKQVIERTDSSVVGTTIIVSRTISTNYSWLVPNQPFPVLTITYSSGETTSIINGGAPIISAIPLSKSVVYNPENITTSTAEIASLGQQRLYPNPTTGFCELQFESNKAQTILITVSDLLGRRLHTYRQEVLAGSNQYAIDLSNHPAGLYILTLSNGEEQISEKIKKYER